jgi:hypothetical protein
MDLKYFSIRDLAIYVCDHLAKQGIETVLTGGACVSIYTKNKFLSYDLDFVLLDSSHRKKLKKIMDKIGFLPEGRHFRNRDTPFIVEFLPPPLSVGEEPVKEIQAIEKRGHKLKLLSPTDCVKDRLSAYYYWNDRPSLEQAAMVFLAQSVDLKEIKRWSTKEGMADKYPIFLEEAKKAGLKR